jgi:hypothetical protein
VHTGTNYIANSVPAIYLSLLYTTMLPSQPASQPVVPHNITAFGIVMTIFICFIMFRDFKPLRIQIAVKWVMTESSPIKN